MSGFSDPPPYYAISNIIYDAVQQVLNRSTIVPYPLFLALNICRFKFMVFHAEKFHSPIRAIPADFACDSCVLTVLARRSA